MEDRFQKRALEKLKSDADAIKRARASRDQFEAMDPDTRADHERQRRLIRETLGQITSV